MEADTARAGFVKRAAVTAALLLVVSRVLALDADVRMHDPSTIIQADGTFYVYAAIVNGGGATDFCVRFIDEVGNPVKGFVTRTTAEGTAR